MISGMDMRFRWIAAILSATLAAAPATTPAMAATGRAGLWNVTTALRASSFTVAPGLAAMLRRTGFNMPMAGQPLASQMCMTPVEVDDDQPPHMNPRDYDCSSRVTGRRGPLMRVESVCHGRREGVARAQIAWRGGDHFDGTYAFRGRISGRPARFDLAFSADWAGPDCRGIRPFIPQAN